MAALPVSAREALFALSAADRVLSGLWDKYQSVLFRWYQRPKAWKPP
jgi:hypothetical protein